LEKKLEVATKIFEYVTPTRLSEVTGLPIEEVKRVYNGGEITQEFIESVLSCFPLSLDNYFAFKVGDEE
jgi:hypothetical protein